MVQKYESRILFLKEFAKELILQSREKQENAFVQEEKIEVPFLETGENLAPTIKPLIPFQQTKKIIHPSSIPQPMPRYSLKPIAPAGFQTSIKTEISKESQFQQPQFFSSTIPYEFNLGKVNFLIQDPRVTVIECPGPGKFLLARTSGQTSMTKISLAQEEIQQILKKFSEQTRIPIISGLFKAAVGNLVVTAVISDLIGSRFIITKITPRFILEQKSFNH
ncbi:MAG: hypothetical protein AABY15_04340 [Nanoarchaeota archaeon]